MGESVYTPGPDTKREGSKESAACGLKERHCRLKGRKI